MTPSGMETQHFKVHNFQADVRQHGGGDYAAPCVFLKLL